MIETFRNQESKDIFKREGPQTMDPEVLRVAQRRLAILVRRTAGKTSRQPRAATPTGYTVEARSRPPRNSKAAGGCATGGLRAMSTALIYLTTV